jgi:cell shape-determining protein MreC
MAAKGNQIDTLHVGNLINEVRRNKRVSYAALGRLTGRTISAISTAMKRSSMQAYMIWEFSQALKHNFFADLADQLQQHTESQLDTPQANVQQELEQLRTENQRLSQELHYLRKAVDMINNT